MESSISEKPKVRHSARLIISLLLCILACLSFSTPVLLAGGRLFATDQEVFIRFAENLRIRSSLVLPSPLNEKYQTSIIDAKENPYVSKHRGLISQYPPFQAIILALFRLVIPNYNLIECIIGAIGVLVFYFLVEHLLGQRAAVFCTIVLIFSPIYFFWCMFALADITAFVLLLLSMLSYLKAEGTHRLAPYALSFCLLGMTVWLKYTNIILVFPFIVHYLSIRGKKAPLLPALIGLLIFGGCIIALLFYHKWAFGGFLTTGYGYNELKLSRSLEGSGNIISLLQRRLLNISILKEIFIKITNLPIHLAICSPLTLAGILGCFSLKRKEWRDYSLLFLVTLTLFGFYISITVHAVGEEYYHASTISSYQRYILPAYCLLMIPAVTLFRTYHFKKLCLVLGFITLLNLSSLGLATINLSNLNWFLADQQQTAQLRQKHLSLTSDGAILIGQHLPFYLVNNTNRHIIHCLEVRHLQSPIFREELDRVVLALLRDAHPVYLVQDYTEPLEFDHANLEVVDEETHLYQLRLN